VTGGEQHNSFLGYELDQQPENPEPLTQGGRERVDMAPTYDVEATNDKQIKKRQDVLATRQGDLAG